MRSILLLVAILAIGAAVVVALAGPGARFGWWDYGTGLAIMRGMKLPAIILAVLAAVLAVVALFVGDRLSALLLVSAVLAGCAAFVPIKFERLVAAHPFIHDITTDFDDPPQIVAGAAMPRKNPPEYVGAQKAPLSDLTVAEAQRKAFPDIKPMVIRTSVDEALRQVQSVMADMNMDILRAGPRGQATTVEATYTSPWFGFVDDFVVRLTPQNEDTRVDVRSKSRVGASDLGANAKRIRQFYKEFREHLSTPEGR